jgi:hypothetical protein
MNPDGTVEVIIRIRNANGKDSDVSVKDKIRWGDDIPKRIDAVASEAATLAWDKRGNVVDRTRRQ